MMPKQEVVAMLLAGGQGSRLGVLTKNLAKPAVPYGGKYRIIDFPLSNCVNSGIESVGVLTQYKPLQLNSYIGSGQAYDLDSSDGGVFILPPYQSAGEVGSWFSGTANAIYQNMAFIENYDPENVLILSGDHIYKMDYNAMLEYHKEKNADCTIAVINVSLEEASRFGIMNTNPDNSIYEFEEKPAHPKSTNASMGIYIFNWKVLRKYLIADEEDPNSSNDFGKNILPAMLADNQRMFAYPFSGYWKDVGTIESLWQANMDLLDDSIPFDLKDPDFKIYARNYAKPPCYVSKDANVVHSLMAEGCTLRGSVEHSIISTGCVIGEGAVVDHSVIMPNTVVEAGAVVEYAIIGEGATIGKNAKVGGSPNKDINAFGVTVIGAGKKIEENQVVNPKEII